MSCLLLAIAGPAQAWGTSSRFSVRDSGMEPSKSGVVGLLACALGRARNESIDDLAALRMGVRVDAAGTLQRDYHTAIGAIRADGSANKDAVVSHRYFLADAAFLVALEGEDNLIDLLNGAIGAPRWPLFMGRKAFPPAGPVARGIDPRGLDEALATAPWTDPSARRTSRVRERLTAGDTVSVRTVIETSVTDATDFRDDQPLSFDPRGFTRRAVRTGTVALTLSVLPELPVT
jgi:CRISPR system Cascade subunit CasD